MIFVDCFLDFGGFISEAANLEIMVRRYALIDLAIFISLSSSNMNRVILIKLMALRHNRSQVLRALGANVH